MKYIFHPDCTVGIGNADSCLSTRGLLTTDREFHPSLKYSLLIIIYPSFIIVNSFIIFLFLKRHTANLQIFLFLYSCLGAKNRCDPLRTEAHFCRLYSYFPETERRAYKILRTYGSSAPGFDGLAVCGAAAEKPPSYDPVREREGNGVHRASNRPAGDCLRILLRREE